MSRVLTAPLHNIVLLRPYLNGKAGLTHLILNQQAWTAKVSCRLCIDHIGKRLTIKTG